MALPMATHCLEPVVCEGPPCRRQVKTLLESAKYTCQEFARMTYPFRKKPMLFRAATPSLVQDADFQQVEFDALTGAPVFPTTARNWH